MGYKNELVVSGSMIQIHTCKTRQVHLFQAIDFSRSRLCPSCLPEVPTILLVFQNKQTLYSCNLIFLLQCPPTRNQHVLMLAIIYCSNKNILYNEHCAAIGDEDQSSINVNPNGTGVIC